MDAIKASQQQAAEAEDKKYNTEILKTQIANKDEGEAQPGQAPVQSGLPQGQGPGI